MNIQLKKVSNGYIINKDDISIYVAQTKQLLFTILGQIVVSEVDLSKYKLNKNINIIIK